MTPKQNTMLWVTFLYAASHSVGEFIGLAVAIVKVFL